MLSYKVEQAIISLAKSYERHVIIEAAEHIISRGGTGAFSPGARQDAISAMCNTVKPNDEEES